MLNRNMKNIKHEKIFLFLTLFSFLMSFLYSENKYFKINAIKGFPYFDREGGLGAICVTSQGNLRNFQFFKNKKIDLSYRQNIDLFKVKQDKEGNIWIIWGEVNTKGSDIFAGILKKGKLYEIKRISEDFEGYNSSSDIAFSINNEKIVIWINYYNEKFNIIVKNLNRNKIWTVYSSSNSVLDPKVLIDNENKIWIFWVEPFNGTDEIFYTFLENDIWQKPLKICSNKVPDITPSVSLNSQGFPMIVWSSYDGNDYEIYYSEWNGMKWNLPQKITQNEGISDYDPCLINYFDYIPVVVWTRVSSKKRDIYLKFKYHNKWSEEINISNDIKFNENPYIVSFNNKIGISWQTNENIEIIYLNELPIKEKFTDFYENLKSNPILTDDKYIAFGNSITYGYINRMPAPEKGYIPRLENLLNSTFGTGEVVNYGVPAETTIGGISRFEETILVEHAFYLLLMEGTNDIIFIRISPETTRFNLEEMIKKCLKYNVFPIIATIIPRKDWFWYSPFFRKRIFKLNDYIHEIANNYSILLADQFKTFYEYPKKYGGWKSLLSDNNHPNEKGYQLMAETWFEKIKDIPFPPIEIEVRREKNEILFYNEILNVITWKPNPKLSNSSTKIEKYLIYRKSNPLEEFELIGEVSSLIYKYFDKKINPDMHYIYAIQAQNSAGIKGPLSNPVEEN